MTIIKNTYKAFIKLSKKEKIILLLFCIVYFLFIWYVNNLLISIFLYYIDITSIEYSFYILLYVRLTILFPSLYIMHIIWEEIKCLELSKKDKYAIHYPCYSITSINYSLFNLTFLFISFYLVDTYIKPYLENLFIYSINKLIEKEFSIKSILKNVYLSKINK